MLTSLNVMLELRSNFCCDHQRPPHPASAWTFRTVTHNRSKVGNISLMDCVPILELPSLRLPLVCSPCEFFQNNFHLSSPNIMHKRARQLQDSRPVVSSARPCCWRFRPQVPGPGPLLASTWLHKPFLSDMLPAMKVSISHCILVFS